MTPQPPTKPTMTRQEELQYHRRLILGLMSTLEAKGLLTPTEINVIIGAAQQAALQPATTQTPKKSAKATPDAVPVIDLKME
ncbi:hypothetical protein [Deinococcus ficus]|uniref:hypothetical protein n=1 Tax=Deinococcus ficus TaxID=317577 RepID=UPI0003B63174|nr:hypothetical protein [Deinococcus ficus]